jgi:hypothetical protein
MKFHNPSDTTESNCGKALRGRGSDGYWIAKSGKRRDWKWAYACTDARGNLIFELGTDDQGKCTAALANLGGGGQYASRFEGNVITMHNYKPSDFEPGVVAPATVKTVVTAKTPTKEKLMIKFAYAANQIIAKYNSAVDGKPHLTYKLMPQLQADIDSLYADYGARGL